MSGPEELRLLVLADPHCATSSAECASAPPRRHCRLGVELLRRALDDARGEFDAVALMGDVLNDGTVAESGATLSAVAETLRQAAGDAPLLVVPGNHDGAPLHLLRALGARAGPARIGPYRFHVFADGYGPGDVCSRPEAERRGFLKLAASDEGGRGPIVVLQHNPMHPPIESDYPFMLTNREDVLADYAAAGVTLSVSGHYHPGQALGSLDGVAYFTAPALCEEPFAYALVSLRGREVSVEVRRLTADPALALVDCHAHTEFAYCGQDISAAEVIARARTLGLSGVRLVEHAPQLYCSAEDFWQGRHIRQPELWRRGRGRADAFRSAMQPLRDGFVGVGLEVELDADGRLTIQDQDRWVDLLVGAVHFLKDDPGTLSDAALAREFMRTCEGLLAGGIGMLAHPWRIFPWSKRPVPKDLYAPLADALAGAGVAAEVNFHGNQPDVGFFTECLRRGVKLAFGSDAHRLEEVGNFGRHVRLLKRAAATTEERALGGLLL